MNATFETLEAAAGWRSIDCLSDIHLHPDRPRTFGALAAYLEDTDADAVLMLGDVFDVWIGDDSRATGFEHACCDLLAKSSARRFTAFMHGNRDFLVGTDFLGNAGLRGLADPTLLKAFGQRILLTHGDSLCLGDVSYQAFRAQVRQPAWRERFLGQPLHERREQARHMREGSKAAQQQLAPHEWVDIDTTAACTWLNQAGSATLIHGHTHRPSEGEMANGFRRWVLSDWDLDATIARGDFLRISSDGIQRLPAPKRLDASAEQHPD